VLAAPADDWGIVGDRLNGFRRMPDRAIAPLGFGMFDAAAEMDVVDHLRPLEFPGVAAGEPFVGIFLLPAVLDDLAEQAEIIADAIADRGDRQCRHTLHETCGEPAKTAIAERRIRFASAQLGQADAEIAESGLEHRQ